MNALNGKFAAALFLFLFLISNDILSREWTTTCTRSAFLLIRDGWITV